MRSPGNGIASRLAAHLANLNSHRTARNPSFLAVLVLADREMDAVERYASHGDGPGSRFPVVRRFYFQQVRGAYCLTNRGEIVSLEAGLLNPRPKEKI